jgi:hypothetical protein
MHHITREVYRKPTSTDITTHYSSNHPTEHKIAAYRYLIKKINILLIAEINRKQELNNTLIIARNNSFPTQLIQRLKDTKTHKRDKTTQQHTNTKKT